MSKTHLIAYSKRNNKCNVLLKVNSLDDRQFNELQEELELSKEEELKEKRELLSSIEELKQALEELKQEIKVLKGEE